MTSKMKKSIIIGFAVFCVIMVSFVAGMNISNNIKSQNLLEESIKSQMLAIAAAASEKINADEFAAYNTVTDTENGDYAATLSELRALANKVGAKYIFALKEIGGKYYFVFDTDTANDTKFTEYAPDQIHLDAFAGISGAGVMNSEDEFGTFNTGAVPIYKDNAVIGIVCADTLDVFVAKGLRQNRDNIILLISVMVVVLAGLGFAVFYLLGKVRKAQDELRKLAMYDKLTELPNRRFLLEYLEEITRKKVKPAFALFFVDLDNFKKVNDNAGHDAGDALLQHIGTYLQGVHGGSKVFRPGSGNVNVAARVGGDEFILLADMSSEEEAAAFAQEILDGFAGILDKNIDKYNVGLSIGVALFPTHTENFHVLIKYADIAMYNIKHNSKNSYSIYSDAMIAAERDR